MNEAFQLPAQHAGDMARLASALNNRPDLNWVYRTACEEFARIFSFDSSFILLYDDSDSHHCQPVWSFQNGTCQPDHPFPVIAEPPTEQVCLKFDKPIVIHSAKNIPLLVGADLLPAEAPRTWLFAGLYHEGEKFGLMGASSKNPARKFSNGEMTLAQAVADQIAAAIVHARLYQSAQKQAGYLESINEITRIALAGGSQKELLDQLARGAVETLFADSCFISLWDSNRKILVPFTAFGAGAQTFLDLVLPLDETQLFETALKEGRPIYAEEPAPPNPGGIHPTNELGPTVRHVIVLPLQNPDGNIGVIRVVITQARSFLSAAEMPYWRKIASQITLAITNIRSIEKEKKRRQEAELIQQATAAIVSSLDLEEVLSLILTNLKQGVPFDSAAICLIEEDHLWIAAHGGSVWHSRQVGERIENSAGLFSLLNNTSSPVFLADAQQHPNYEQWSQDGDFVIHGWMGVPLIAEDRTIGYLLLNSRECDVYTPDYARLAQSFASQAAAAIEKARLFEQVRNGRERLHALSKKLVEIQENERRFLAHELHDEIGQELTGLQFILEMGKEGPRSSRLEALTEAQQLVAGLMAQVRELSLNLHPTMIDDLGLLPAFKAHFDRFQQKTGIQIRFSSQNLDWRFPSEVEVSAFRVVQEALTNVARHARVKEVEVNISADTVTLMIQVKDRGQGFDTRILQDSSRSFGIGGMRERTELAGGKFELFSKPGEGTQIRAAFPTGQKLERRKSDRKSHAGR